MLERRTLGEIAPKPHSVFKPKGKTDACHEFVFTRDGFSGGFSLLYQKHPPTNVSEYSLFAGLKDGGRRLIGEKVPHHEVPLMRRHIQTWQAPEGSDFLTSRTALFVNPTCRISVVRGKADSTYAFCNGDADECFFVYDGGGELLTMFGALPYRKNDYIIVPRGVPYVFRNVGPSELLVVEGAPSISIPSDFKNPHGQLKLEAPYTHRDFRSPARLLNPTEVAAFNRIVTLRNDTLTEHIYSASSADTIGWDGSVYPIAFNILDYLPKTGKVHLPPNLHLTFIAQGFVVCSFVPRMVDYGEGAIPCPYPHANVACDEFLYYVSGNFTSRKGVAPRSVSFHPAGIPHGPQPGAYFASVGSKTTEELAVMVDTFQPLHYTKAALGMEDAAYATSWRS